MGRIGGTAAGDSLMRLTGTADRDMVAEALGTMRSRDATGVLTRLLGDQRADVRRQAAVALGKTGGPDQVEAIVGLLADRHHSVRFAAAAALEGLGATSAETLVRRMGDLPGEGRFLAVRTLGALGHRPAVDALAAVLARDRWWIRAAAAEALGALGETALLRDALNSESHAVVRGRIGSVLQEQGTP
jgi:HEAT repeat protein